MKNMFNGENTHSITRTHTQTQSYTPTQAHNSQTSHFGPWPVTEVNILIPVKALVLPITIGEVLSITILHSKMLFNAEAVVSE